MEQSFRQCYIRNALDGAADDILQGNSDLNCPDLNSNLGESVNSECETGCTNEEESKWINFIYIFSFLNTTEFYV